MADYHINLAKSLASPPEKRTRFYNRMVIYLAVCAVALVFVAYISTLHLRSYMQSRRAQHRLITSASAISGFDQSIFNDPGEAYARLEAYSTQAGVLRQVLGQRVQLLPIVHNLFAELPGNVVLQSLVAGKDRIEFGMDVPLATESSGDPVRKLQASWKSNEKLMARVAGIRQVTGERRTMGVDTVFFVQFECVLKK